MSHSGCWVPRAPRKGLRQGPAPQDHRGARRPEARAGSASSGTATSRWVARRGKAFQVAGTAGWAAAREAGGGQRLRAAWAPAQPLNPAVRSGACGPGIQVSQGQRRCRSAGDGEGGGPRPPEQAGRQGPGGALREGHPQAWSVGVWGGRAERPLGLTGAPTTAGPPGKHWRSPRPTPMRSRGRQQRRRPCQAPGASVASLPVRVGSPDPQASSWAEMDAAGRRAPRSRRPRDALFLGRLGF